MIVRGFKSVIWVATVGGAALSCYMVSLQVATERAELAKVERQILAAKREIRSLQTELGTRGRLSQLEHWNAEVLALSAPSSAQFLQDEVKLARFERIDPTLDERSAEVRLAALSTGDEVPAVPARPRIVHAVAPSAAPALPTVHRASYTPSQAIAAPAPRQSVAEPQAPKPQPAIARPTGEAATTNANRPAGAAAASKPAAKPAQDKARSRNPAENSAKPVVVAKADAKASGKGTLLAKADTKPASAKPRASRIDGKLAAEIQAGVRQGEGSGGN
jgi:hypothetical protein